MKTADELKELKEKVETMSRKRRELTEEELEQVSGGITGIYGGGTFVDETEPDAGN